MLVSGEASARNQGCGYILASWSCHTSEPEMTVKDVWNKEGRGKQKHCKRHQHRYKFIHRKNLTDISGIEPGLL
jgi:hypothetical protein